LTFQLANLWICGIAPPAPHATGADSVVMRANTELLNTWFEQADTGIGDMHFSWGLVKIPVIFVVAETPVNSLTSQPTIAI
jgi:hypothetical protein